MAQDDVQIDDIIAEVRCGNSDWVVYYYQSKTELRLLKRGNDGLKGMSSALQEKNVNYALLRVEKGAGRKLPVEN